MPQVGFGLWKVPKDVCSNTVFKAIELGYRHLDSASDYGNEKEVGQGIKAALEKGLCTREELWIHLSYGIPITIPIMFNRL